LRDAIDGVAADAREVCHAHVAQPAFIDEREARDARIVARKRSAHFIEETAIDLKDDFEMPRKQCEDCASEMPAPSKLIFETSKRRFEISVYGSLLLCRAGV